MFSPFYFISYRGQFFPPRVYAAATPFVFIFSFLALDDFCNLVFKTKAKFFKSLLYLIVLLCAATNAANVSGKLIALSAEKELQYIVDQLKKENATTTSVCMIPAEKSSSFYGLFKRPFAYYTFFPTTALKHTRNDIVRVARVTANLPIATESEIQLCTTDNLNQSNVLNIKSAADQILRTNDDYFL